MMYSLATVLTTALRQQERQYGRSRRAAMRKTCETRAREEPDKSRAFSPAGTSLPGQARRSHPLFQFPTEG
jgi:hypothetical protein